MLYVNGWREGEVYTLAAIHHKMVEYTGSEENAYGIKCLRKKLKEKYGSHGNFISSEGKTFFQRNSGHLINDKWYQDKLLSG